ncbi:MAG TPA: hypothetical protein VIJ59_09340 [Caulobacteraceae bacterium]
MVIRYGFLWSHEKTAGGEEGSKDRPCAIVVAAPRRTNGDIAVIVAPITHALPEDLSTSMEIPSPICRALGLDRRRHWLRLDELNRFVWPGYDLRTIPGKPGEYAYGMLPRPMFEHLRTALLDRQRAMAPHIQRRD